MRWTIWIWARLLMTMDRLFGTQLFEWELYRRHRRIDDLVADLDNVNQELEVLKKDLALNRLLLCLAELQARSEYVSTSDWLRYVPDRDEEEALLDTTIEFLVKPQLATLDTKPQGPNQYVYRLNPDWDAIRMRLSDVSLSTELAAWLDKQSRQAETQRPGAGDSQHVENSDV